MKLKTFNLVSIAFAILIIAGSYKSFAQKRVLVFTKVAGYPHDSRPAAAQAITKLGLENNFLVDTTSDASKIEENNLKQYAALIFVSTTGSFLNNFQQADLQRYIQAGGGFVGIHAAADAEYDWHWYGRMIGGYFSHHPAQQMATLRVVDKNNGATSMLPDEWKRWDEWYHYKSVAKDIHVLINLEESSLKYNKNGSDDKFKMGASHPIAWYHDFEGGRVFYTGLGHTKESYTEDLFLQHLLGGIKYAMGNGTLNYANVKAQRVPTDDRFTKTQLITGVLNEPTEMTILPNLDILIIQRKGEILKYDHITKKVKQVGFLKAYIKTLTPAAAKINAEEGVLGLQADPDFKTNHYIYIYYSPAGSESVNQLSRFTFENDTVNVNTEKVVLKVKSQREICCHTGGSIAFGKDRLLYLSTGDNTTPFDEPNVPKGGPNTNSFAPLDDRPGFEQYDDRRAAGNTNDLRGKILRIKMNVDGTYDIPEGNLFPKETEKTRPEIYVMGDRNPYRIAVDKKNGFLYWGEVGPDANNDSLETRGSRGYDEVNQARKAGFFGWPLFVGPNVPYHEYDYNTGKSGPAFDPLHPVNNSRNNTGLTNLPPAQPAFIWYPYAASKEFPQVGTGGRTAMGGPVYYGDLYQKAGLPSYYNGKLFIYEWIRGWIKAVTLTPEGDYDSMEPFMGNTKFVAPVDMEIGPDGKMYVLEYGNGWFQKNADAGLARIDYNSGNLAPEVTSLTSSKATGKPLTFMLTATAVDPENDGITYTWNLGNGVRKTTPTNFLRYTYPKKGNYSVSVVATDNNKARSKVKTLKVAAGVTAVVAVAAPVNANDPGKALMMSMDCVACHKVAERSIGPAFTDVAKKYDHNSVNKEKLSQKVIAGGTGVWGDVVMPAHPSLKPDQAKQIISWIFTLAPKK
jgi:cytochrome c